MRVAHFLNESSVNFEERKRALQRREMSETYKKNASFVQASKNPMLEMLENLLSGKTEKELHESISLMDEDRPYIEQGNTEGNEEQLELVRTVELEQNEDLMVPASVSTQIQQMASQIASENNFELNDEEPFANEPLDFRIPERFINEFDWNINQETVFGKDLESLIYQRTYNKAISKYTYQMEMAKKGFLMDGSILSLTA